MSDYAHSPPTHLVSFVDVRSSSLRNTLCPAFLSPLPIHTPPPPHISGFTIPPNYTPSQVWEAIKAPAWSWDFLANPAYNYACINTEVPADSLAAFVNSQINPAFDWKDAEWLLGEWGMPSAIKGVVRPDDAIKAKEIGFSTMWVSNHGARQLETSPATIDVLPSIREAVGPDTEVRDCSSSFDPDSTPF